MSKAVVIIGGGFCGTLCAVRLLQDRSNSFTRIVLIDAGVRAARGLAYGTNEPLHLLNVPAGRMSAFPEYPQHFLEFAQSHDATVQGADFLPRELYGRYLENLLLNAQIENEKNNREAAIESVEFLKINDTAIDLNLLADGQASIDLQSGAKITADKIILALGNNSPRAPSITDPHFFSNSARYIGDPWIPGALARVDNTQPVLLIGTGLTAIDVITTLQARGFSAGLHAVSRHGLVPLAHRGLSHAGVETLLPSDLFATPLTIRRFLNDLRAYIDTVAPQHIDWRDVLTALRKHTPWLWQSLDSIQRARFLRHCQTYWDVHRHRVAPRIAKVFNALIAEKKLRVQAGRLINLLDFSTHVEATVRDRVTQASESLTVGTVINCTGPQSRIDSNATPLSQALLRRGLLSVDKLGLGLVVDESYAVVGADGESSPLIHYVGPLLKADYWEATAVPELREHVARLIEKIIDKE